MDLSIVTAIGQPASSGLHFESLSRKGGEVDVAGWVKPTDLQARQGLPVVGFTHPTTVRPGLWNRLSERITPDRTQVGSVRLRRNSRRTGWLRRSIWRASWGSSRLAWRFSR